MYPIELRQLLHLDGPDPKSRDILRVPPVGARKQGNFFFDCELGYQSFDNG
jgi:hypothetical protein